MPLRISEITSTLGLTGAIARANFPFTKPPLKGTTELSAHGARQAIVLGAGGVSGLVWQATALSRLQRDGTLPESLDDVLLVGTSAGALNAALLRCGLTTHHVLDLMTRGHIEYKGSAVALPDSLPRDHVGAPGPAPSWWERAAQFLFGPLPRSRELLEELRAAVDQLWNLDSRRTNWPSSPTWLVATHATSGRRVVFGSDERGPTTTLGSAVAASCAIPLLLSSVLIDNQQYTDGALSSISSVDLALLSGAEEVIVLDPAAGTPSTHEFHPRAAVAHLLRTLHGRTLAAETELAGRLGVALTVVTPSAAEMHAMGTSLLDPSRAARIIEAGNTVEHNDSRVLKYSDLVQH